MSSPNRKKSVLLWTLLREEWKIWVAIAGLLGLIAFFSNQLAVWLTNSAFIKISDALGKLGVFVAAIAFLREIPKWEERDAEAARQRQFEYWKAIDSARASGEAPDGRFFSSALRIALESLAKERDVDGNPIQLRDVQAKGANLADINLENAALHVCTFVMADLSQANFRNAKLGTLYFQRARLFGTDFSGATYQEIWMRHALYDEATKFPDGFDPQQARAYKIGLGADLRGAMLENASLWNCPLENADLREANLSQAVIGGIDANLKYANLKDANLTGARAGSADLRWAILQNANLQNARLQDAKLDDADLQGADLRGAKYITVDQIKAAKNWEHAIYDDDFRQHLGMT